MDTHSARRVALLSIRPEYARAIFDGQKTVEFRRAPIASDVDTVLVYATLPVGHIVGWFTVRRVRESTPSALWRRFSSVAGIGRSAYFEYFDGATRAYGIEIETVTPLAHPVPLERLAPGLRAPQSVQYLPAAAVQALTETRSPRSGLQRMRPAFA